MRVTDRTVQRFLNSIWRFKKALPRIKASAQVLYPHSPGLALDSNHGYMIMYDPLLPLKVPAEYIYI